MLAGVLAAPGWAQTPPDDAEVYYAVRRSAAVYMQPDSARKYFHLGFREPVYVLGTSGHWHHIQSEDGAKGYVHTSALSNVWIRVSKRTQTVLVYRGGDLLMRLAADLGTNFFADKEKRGSVREPDHWRTPDGVFFVVRKNPRSQFYKAFVLNYPTAEDAERGFERGLISQGQRDAIVRAERLFEMPPMNTPLGGWIEIHGKGTGMRTNWTQGCIAIQNAEIDRLWSLVEVGTPVLVEP